MNRLAALVEKEGAPRERVFSDEELTKFIAAAGENAATFFYGHDYEATAVAHFFTLAESQRLQLNSQEEHLLSVMLGASVLHRGSAGYLANEPKSAVISTVQPQSDDPATPQNETVDAQLRETILRHELSHGEFFTNDAYRHYCEQFWHTNLSERERLLFRNFLSQAGYDPSDETLMINETQAYLMHTPDPRAFSAKRLGATSEELDDLRRRFAAGHPPTLLLNAAGEHGS